EGYRYAGPCPGTGAPPQPQDPGCRRGRGEGRAPPAGRQGDRLPRGVFNVPRQAAALGKTEDICRSHRPRGARHGHGRAPGGEGMISPTGFPAGRFVVWQNNSNQLRCLPPPRRASRGGLNYRTGFAYPAIAQPRPGEASRRPPKGVGVLTYFTNVYRTSFISRTGNTSSSQPGDAHAAGAWPPGASIKNRSGATL